jgi:hypothetical protein
LSFFSFSFFSFLFEVVSAANANANAAANAASAALLAEYSATSKKKYKENLPAPRSWHISSAVVNAPFGSRLFFFLLLFLLHLLLAFT